MRTHSPARGGILPASLCITLITSSLCACAAQDDDDDGADEANDDVNDEANDDGSSSAESGDESSGEALEIEGDWTDDFMGVHSITATSWTQTFGTDTLVFAIATYDNADDTLVAQDEGDATWGKFQWSAATDGAVFYCQIAYGAASQADADAAALADATDPATGGCGMFPWTLLTPAM